MNITLTDKDLQTDLTDSGQAIDVLALSLDQYTSNEVYESSSDYESEVIDYVIEHYDFEKAFITRLNEQPHLLMDIFSQNTHRTNPYAEFEKQELLAGAYLAVEYPEVFADSLDDYTNAIKDDQFQYYDPSEIMPKDLAEELQSAVDSYHEDQDREWLYGSRDFAGILVLAERAYDVTDVSVDRAKNEVYFELDEDEAREIIRGNSYDYEDEKVDKMTGKKLEKATKEQLIDWINSKGNSVIAKKRAENEKRREDYAKTKAYQEERKEQAEAERKEKLLQMTK